LSEFSGDESFACFVSAAATFIGAVVYYGSLIRTTSLGAAISLRYLLGLFPLACAALLLPFLLYLSSHEVQEDHAYVALFLLALAAWLEAAIVIGALLGISFQDDAIERNNPAAVVALCGAMLGMTGVYAGANVGEGSTIWMTFGPAVLGAVTWGAGWLLLELLGAISDSVAIDRNVNSALRLAGFLIVSGILLGWALAGNYESAQQTVDDLIHRGWPVIPLAVGIAVVQRYSNRRKRMSR
jgi:hypothetical protein